ncbi:hypothetical protein [Neopusillimonas maritima]|uniref:Uncharacterized protein n=1 Tax=Neopusillimonas maritima TaxID=2026239 RepID=A0ABX9N0M3_9BURK|nr:hypothetical protein [Neopusillimonas maritima]RII84368.1 hypothetical protein CJO09_03920 [Neopusillimonas maritima]
MSTQHMTNKAITSDEQSMASVTNLSYVSNEPVAKRTYRGRDNGKIVNFSRYARIGPGVQARITQGRNAGVLVQVIGLAGGGCFKVRSLSRPLYVIDPHTGLVNPTEMTAVIEKRRLCRVLGLPKAFDRERYRNRMESWRPETRPELV